MISFQTWEKSIQPQHSTEILGNDQIISDIKNYITNNTSEQILLALGPPGLGKSTACKLVLSELGYQTVTVRMSHKDDLDNIDTIIQGCSGTGSILNWGKVQKKALIVDELECLPVQKKCVLQHILRIHNPVLGISRSSKKRLKRAKEIYRKKDLPVVFLCNTMYHRTLEEIQKYGNTFIFKKSTEIEQYIWCETIGSIMDIRLTKHLIKHILAKSCADIRQLSFIMFYVMQRQFKGDNLIKIRKAVKSIGVKEEDDHLFDLLHKTITKQNHVEKCMTNYDKERILLPWMIFENIYTYFSKIKFDCSSSIANIAQCISDCDLIWEKSHGHQDYQLEDYYGAISCWSVPYIYKRAVPQHLRQKITYKFPSLMVKRSQIKLYQNYYSYLVKGTMKSRDHMDIVFNIFKDYSLEEVIEFALVKKVPFIDLDRLCKLCSFKITGKKNWKSSEKKKLKLALVSLEPD